MCFIHTCNVYSLIKCHCFMQFFHTAFSFVDALYIVLHCTHLSVNFNATVSFMCLQKPNETCSLQMCYSAEKNIFFSLTEKSFLFLFKGQRKIMIPPSLHTELHSLSKKHKTPGKALRDKND